MTICHRAKCAANWRWIPLAGLLVAMGCGRTEVISVDGSSTVFQISAAVAEMFDEVGQSINVVVGKSGTGGGMKKFSAGEIDVCDASRPITVEESAACKKARIEFVELQIAYDGLAVTVNPRNDWCNELTVDQLKTIWRKESDGSIATWKDVNPDWPAEKLKLYGPGRDSGTFDYFTEVITGEKGNSRNDYQPSEDDNDLVVGVAGDKGALGYFGYSYYAENKQKLKLLAIDGGGGPIKPDPENVRNGTYKPLSRPLFIYVKKSSLAKPSVQEFLKFYLANVASAATKVGYVPLPAEVEAMTQAAFDAALKEKS